METKHLFLLMIVPVILVGLVLYAGSGAKITGFAVKESKESNILGTYSINPSFKTKIDYSLDDYAKIKEKLGFIIKCSQEGKDIETCIGEVNKDSSFTWQLNCDKGAEKVLYDFAEFVQNCIDSDDNNCLCTKGLENEKVQESMLAGKYNIEISEYASQKQLIISTVKVNEKEYSDLSQAINTKDVSVRFPKQYILAYTNDKLFGLNLIFTEISGEIRSLGPLNEIVLYKNSNNPDKIKAIDFVRQENDNLIYSTPGKIIQKSIDLHPCQLKPKNIYKFCVTQNNYKVVAFDRLDGQIKERNPVIKFASHVPDLPPAPLKNLEAIDRPKAEKSVLLKWDKSDEKDIAKFRIYYSDSSLKAFEKPIDDVRKNPNAIAKEIDAKAIEINAPFNLAECEFDFSNKKCLFPAEIENNKLYYSSFFNAYVYSLNVPEDRKSYDFSVTAVDRNNNEIDNIKSKMPLQSIQSIDDLSPSSENNVVLRLQQIYDDGSKKVTFNFGEEPLKNIDGTPLANFNNYKVYYLKYNSLTQEEKAKEISKILDWKLKNLKFLASVNYEQKGQPFFVDLSATSPASSNVYLFVITPTDINGNPKEGQYKPKEIGAQVLQLVIP